MEPDPIYVTSASPPEVDTQRQAPLTEASLPIRVTKKKGKGKGKTPQKLGAEKPSNRYEIPTPADTI